MNDRYIFRGKTTYDKWVDGDLITFGGRCYIHPQNSDFEVKSGLARIVRVYKVIPETVGQCTGLKDKNGKLIFEGDILKQKTTPEFAKVNSFKWELYGIVRFGYYDWNEGTAGYASMSWYIEPLKSVSIKPKNYSVGHIHAGLNQWDILNKYYPMDVIGNIHDNPELLEVEE